MSYAKPIARPTFGFGLAALRSHNTLGNYRVYWSIHALRIEDNPRSNPAGFSQSGELFKMHTPGCTRMPI